MLDATRDGLLCPAGGFHVDPWAPVAHAVITHAHADHARLGCGRYLVAEPGAALLRARLGDEAVIETIPWGERRRVGDVTLSMHSAGHVLGSSQVRLEHEGIVWVVSGDYKRQHDPTCTPFEPVECDCFITEATYALPVFRWAPPAQVIGEINAWWAANRAARRTSILFAYALGKAQRLLASIDPQGPILAHGAVRRLVDVYRASGVDLPPVHAPEPEAVREAKGTALVLAPPAAAGSPWLRRFGKFASAFASGWMQLRGMRRRRHVDRGFAISDHADWLDLLETISETGARRVGVTHGYTDVLSRYLDERGIETFVLPTRYEGEEDESRK